MWKCILLATLIAVAPANFRRGRGGLEASESLTSSSIGSFKTPLGEALLTHQQSNRQAAARPQSRFLAARRQHERRAARTVSALYVQSWS